MKCKELIIKKKRKFLLSFYCAVLLGLSGCAPKSYILKGKEVHAVPEIVFAQKELKQLSISGTSIEVFPDKLSTLKKLKRLDLSNNKLCKVPSFLGRLTHLRELSLANNGLHQMATTAPIWDINYVERLAKEEAYAYQEYLDTNRYQQLSSIAASKATTLSKDISYIQTLKDRSSWNSKAISFPRTPEHMQYIQAIFDKDLEDFPKEINQLTQLKSLELQGNLYTDAFVRGLDPMALKELKILNLSNNALITFPMHLGKLKQLESLDLSHNIMVTLPDKIQGFEQLKHLDLSHTHIYIIPRSLEKLEYLESLNLSHLGGLKLSKAVGKLHYLKSLDLNNASFEALPLNIGDLQQLEYLNLKGSRIKDLPDSFKNLKNLKKIVLSEDQQKIKEQVENYLPHCSIDILSKE